MRIHLTNDYSLKLVLSAAKANNDCPWVTAYVPSDNPQPAMGIGNTNGVTAVEIVPAPGTDVGTSVRSVIIQNDDTKETTFKLQITNGTTTKEFSKTVAVGARLDLLAEDSLVTDHGELTGKSDDDHTQYLLVAGTRAFTGDQSMGDNALTGIKKTVFTAATEKTVSSGTLTVDQGVHKVQPESGTADDIDTISGMTANSSMILFASDAGTDTLTLKHGTGNISCFTGADIDLSTGFVLCYYDGTNVYLAGDGGGGGLVNTLLKFSAETFTPPSSSWTNYSNVGEMDYTTTVPMYKLDSDREEPMQAPEAFTIPTGCTSLKFRIAYKPLATADSSKVAWLARFVAWADGEAVTAEADIDLDFDTLEASGQNVHVYEKTVTIASLSLSEGDTVLIVLMRDGDNATDDTFASDVGFMSCEVEAVA